MASRILCPRDDLLHGPGRQGSTADGEVNIAGSGDPTDSLEGVDGSQGAGDAEGPGTPSGEGGAVGWSLVVGGAARRSATYASTISL